MSNIWDNMTDEQLYNFFIEVWHQLKPEHQNLAYDVLTEQIESGEGG